MRRPLGSARVTPLTRSRILLLALSVSLAGCAAPDADPGADDADPSGDEVAGNADSPAVEGDTSDEDDASSPGERWHGFDFDRQVTPRSGGSGTLQSFTARISQEEDGEVATYDMKVEVGEATTRDIRTKKMTFSGTAPSEETITTPLEVRELTHTITIVKDDSGEREVGEVTVFSGFEPVDVANEAGTFLLGYAAMEWTDADGSTGLMEYYVPGGQQPADGSMYLPYQEGESDFSGHWAFGLFGMAYNPALLAGWTDGSQEFEEGSWSFGGASYEVERKSLSVSGYTFDGWHVEWGAAADGSTATWSFDVATSLPVPFAYTIGGTEQGGSGSSLWTWELREIRLG